MHYLEDIQVGQKDAFGSYDVTREEIIAFASKYDAQPFHLDDDAAAETHFGRLAASGWHTCSMTMSMIVANMERQGNRAGLGSPGVDELRWLKPVHPGDRLRVETEVVEVRPSRSRPDIGSVKTHIVVLNQDDAPVMKMTSIVLVKRRPA